MGPWCVEHRCYKHGCTSPMDTIYFGEDLIFAARGGSLFWDATDALTTRGVLLSSETNASNVPVKVNTVLVSDNRFVFCFGTNVLGSTNLDPMLLRWSGSRKCNQLDSFVTLA